MKDDIMKGLYFLQGLPTEKYNEELVTRFKNNLLPKIIAYMQSAEEPQQEIFEAAKEIFGNV